MSRKQKNLIDAYLRWSSESESEEICHKWSIISAIAACLQRKCYHRIGNLVFYPNFFLVILGPSGARKSTAIDPIESLLTELGVSLAQTTGSKEKLIDSLCKLSKRENLSGEDSVARFDLKQPVLPHASLTAIADELTVFLSKRDEDLPGHLIKLFDCKDTFTYKTYAHSDMVVENVFLNLLGGTTPEKLKTRMTREMIGEGLFGRFLFIYTRGARSRNAYPIDTRENSALRADIIHDLREILMMAGPFKPTEGWLDVYVPWYETDSLHHGFDGTAFEDGYQQRRGMYMNKICMCLSAARSSKKVLDKEDFLRGLEYMEEAEARMHEIASGIGASEYGRGVDNVITFLRQVPGKITFSKLMERFVHQHTYKDLMGILFGLEQAGKVKLTRAITGQKDLSGRDTTEIIVRYIRDDSPPTQSPT